MKKLYFLAIAVVLVSVFSCTKMKLNKLEGKWDYVTMSAEDSIFTTWEFKDDNSFKEVISYSGGDSVFVEIEHNGTYSFNKQGGSYYLEIFDVDSSATSIEGQHVVKELKKDVLKLLQIYDANGGAVYFAREFVKK